MNVNVTVVEGKGTIVITCEMARFVSFSVTSEKSEEPPVKSVVEICNVVSLFKKLQVNAPAVDGAQTFVDSSTFPEPFEAKV